MNIYVNLWRNIFLQRKLHMSDLLSWKIYRSYGCREKNVNKCSTLKAKDKNNPTETNVQLSENELKPKQLWP